MRRRFVQVALVFILALMPSLTMRAQSSPEDEYVGIFSLIQEADALNEAAKSTEALGKYQEAEDALKKFQMAHPDWNKKIIEFRLDYVASKIKPLKGRTANVAEERTPPPPFPTIKPAAMSSDLESKIKALQGEIKQMTTEKAALEAKVKELSSQPAPAARVDTSAQETIKTLQKQNSELKAGLEEQKKKSDQLVEVVLLDQAKKALTEANQKLAQQAEVMGSLQKEKETLQRNLDSATAVHKSSEEMDQIKQALAEANRKLAQQTETAGALTREKEALQKNLDSVSKTTIGLTEFELTKAKLDAAVQKITQQAETINALMRDRESLQKNLEQEQVKSTAAKNAAPVGEPAEMKAMQEQVRQLQSDKALLEAKLKEALAARPAATDSTELAKAEEKIKELQKQNELLKTSIEERQAALLKGNDAGLVALEQMRRDLADARQKLAAQNEQASTWAVEKKAMQQRIQSMSDQAATLETLRNENESLKKQLNEAMRGNSVTVLDEARKALDDSNRKLAQQVELANALAAEKEILQKRLDSLSATGNAVKELEQARQALAIANHKLAVQTEAAIVLLAEVNVKLERQLQVTAALTQQNEVLWAENEVLKKQAASVRSKTTSAGNSIALSQKLAETQAQLAALQSDKEMLRIQKTALEQQVKQNKSATANTNKTASPSAEELQKIKQLEEERDALQKKLQGAVRELNSRSSSASSAKIGDMAEQLAALRARLNVLEAQPVPYTKDELALFKQPDSKLSIKPNLKTSKDLSAKAKKLLTQAKRDFAAKDFDKSEEKYKEVLREDGQNIYVLGNLASIQLEMNKTDAAEENLKRALALDSNDVYSLSVLGNLKFRQKDYDAALDSLSRAAKLDPQNAEVQNLLGITLSHKGMRGPAETALRKAIQIDPGFAGAHNNLAVIYISQEPPLVELARWHYQKALSAGSPRNMQLEKILETWKSNATSVKPDTTP